MKLILITVFYFLFEKGWAKQEQKFVKHIGLGLHKMHLRNSFEVEDCGPSEAYYFKDAIVDNFAPAEKQQKWVEPGQRYWINREYFSGAGAPIFVFIGGEGKETCRRLASFYLYIHELAKKYGGLLIDIEHRFYGESYPTAGMSTEELKYLSSKQALADLARLISFVKLSLFTEASNVITIGGSYPGNLAAWFRLKYPHISRGSIASSAPLFAKLNFVDYMEVVGDAIKFFSGQKCYDAFEVAAGRVAELVGAGLGSVGVEQLEQDFQLCSPLSQPLDIAILLSDLMGNIQYTVQGNSMPGSAAMTISDICAVMLDTENEDFYTQFVKLSALYRTADGIPCEDASWTDTVTYLSSPAKDPDNMWRPWTYQTCNEFGYFQTADSMNQPFHAWRDYLGLDVSARLCAAAFDGWTIDERMIASSNRDYGGLAIGATDSVYPHGTIDPWHALGVTNSTAPLPQPSAHPVYILGTAHCRDMYAASPSDPPALTQARAVIDKRVAEWLA